jgi:thiamine transport system permease protein
VVLVFGALAGSTIEVEVYRRARIEGDPSGASALALAETLLALSVVAGMAASRGRGSSTRKAGSPSALLRPRGRALAALLAYALLLLVFFIGPLLALAAEAFTVRAGMGGTRAFGLGNFARLLGAPRAPFLRSLGDTLATALPAAFLACAGGGFAALGLGRGRSAAGAVIASLPLAVSGIVAALGWSLLFPSGGNALVVAALAFAALPFVAKSVSGALAALDRAPSEAARTLGATRLRAALGVELPSVSPSLLAAGAFAFAIAAGDLNAPIMLGRDGFEPLPLLLYRLSSAYRFPEACAAGLLLGLLTLAVFFFKEGSGGDA